MALSIISIPGDGVTDTFNVSFALGILDRTSVTAWVTGEVDGGGNKVYRNITYLTDTMLKISGTPAGAGIIVVFTRTVSQTNLIVNYEDGDIMNEVNLNTAQKQALMLVHQVLDGRFSAFIQNVSAGGFRITNLGTPVASTDAANKAYVDSVVQTGANSAAAAAASAAAAAASASASSTSAANSSTSATNSLTYSNNSLTYRDAANQSAIDAQAANVASYAAYQSALSAQNKAQEWSDKPEDVFVTGTTEYSAFHWARKALGYVTGSIAAVVHGATQKTVLVDADETMITDSAASFGLKRTTFANIVTYIFGVFRTFSAGIAVNGGITQGQAAVGPGQISLNGGIAMGVNRVADGTANLDFYTAAGGSVLSAHIIRNTGTNGALGISNDTGTGGIKFYAASAHSSTFTFNGSQILLANVALSVGTGGYSGTYANDGNAPASYMPTENGGNMRLVLNNGAFTFLADTDATTKSYTSTVIINNTASAGAVTFSGWNAVTGDALTTVNAARFVCYITKHGGVKTINIQAL